MLSAMECLQALHDIALGWPIKATMGTTGWLPVEHTTVMHAHDTRSRNRRHKSTPFSGAGFSYNVRLE